jgi:hypothetical protein
MPFIPNELEIEAAEEFCIRRISYAEFQFHSMIVIERKTAAKETEKESSADFTDFLKGALPKEALCGELVELSF